MRLPSLICALQLSLLALTPAAGAAIPNPDAGEVPVAQAGAAGADALPTGGEAPQDPLRVLTPGGIDPLERAWFAPAQGARDRVDRLRWVAEQAGFENLDAPAQAVLAGALGVTGLERAELAVELSPLLPAAQAAYARELWSNGDPGAALQAWWAAACGLWKHLEAFLWFSATTSVVLLAACLGAGAGYLALRGLTALPLAARDLGELLEPAMQGFARIALLASLVLAPAVFGEGLLGSLLVLYALAVVYATPAARKALIGAAAVALLALEPGARGVGRVLGAVGADPLAEATWSSEQGFLDPVDSERLDEGSDRDALALHAVARRYRRAGDLATAAAQFGALVSAQPDDPVLLNDLANLHFAQREMEEAIGLYRKAAKFSESPEIWFNLSQAHGNRIEIGQHDRALDVAQSIDRVRVGELTQRLSEARSTFVADLPIPTSRYRQRLYEGAGAPVAEQLRERWAPGRLGAHPAAATIAFVLMTAAGVGARRRLAVSSWCGQCSAIVPPSPGTGQPPPLCEVCRNEREASFRKGIEPLPPRPYRMLGHRVLGALAMVWPGFGPRSQRPLAALVGLIGLSLVGSAGLWGRTLLPDPMAVGDAAQLFTAMTCSAGAALYLTAVGFQWHAREGP